LVRRENAKRAVEILEMPGRVTLLGLTRVNVINRVSSIILAALAVHYVFDSIDQSGLLRRSIPNAAARRGPLVGARIG